MYNLLLVDDEPIIRRGIKSMTNLRDMGIREVLEAGNASSAFSVLAKNDIDIVFLDINMPDTDGLSLASSIREKDPHIRIVMITGYDYFDYMQTAIRIGVDDYLLKPVSKSDIEQVLKRVISRLEQQNVESALEQILHTENDSENVESDIIARYLKSNLFSKEFSLFRMANDLGFNSSYLSSVFKKRFGITFQEYTGIKRMEYAKLLLLSKDMKNSEIAEAVGYEDVNYFISKFKKTYHISPKQFRQSVIKNEN